MAIQFTCGKCGTLLQVRDEHIGKRLRCPNCKNEIPSGQSSAPESPAAEFSSAPQSPRDAFQAEPDSDNPYVSPPPVYGPSSVYDGSRRMRPHRGGTILTLGILGLVCCWPFAVAAWVMGAQDLSEIRQGRMDRSGEGLTQAGMIIGIIGVAILVLTVVIGALTFVAR